MKSLLSAVIYAAIITQNESCDLVKKYTGKEWHELPDGTKAFLVIAAIWGASILFLIGNYSMTDSEDQQP